MSADSQSAGEVASMTKTLEAGGVQHYLAHSPQPTKAGLLLLPYFYGITTHIRGLAEMYAGLGFTTLVWNPYPDVAWGAPITVATRPARPNDEASIVQQMKCIDVLENDFHLDSIGTIGYCMGARSLLLLAAREHRLRAAVSCYPSIHMHLEPGEDLDPIAAAKDIECPVQVLSAGNDTVTSVAVYDALQAALESRRLRTAETHVHFYPDAGHGFMHIPDPGNDAATRSALPLVQAFLEIHLANRFAGNPLPWPTVRGNHEPSTTPVKLA
jgi:carboxymethylenebutenolidase